MRKIIYIIISAMLISACGKVQIPNEYQDAHTQAPIYPDYAGVAIPCNIAPLNFMLTDSTIRQVAARITSPKGMQISAGDNGREIIFDAAEWRDLISGSKGDSIAVEIYACNGTSGWRKYNDIHIYVADSKIDPYISYRLIEPSYQLYENMCIAQRCMESNEESVIYSTKKVYGQCVNCHSYQNYKTGNMLYHKRVADAGTVIRVDGVDRVVNLKRQNTISPGVYPAWHPSERLIAFSTNKTHQMFHTQNINKVEVYDTESDLILYDVDSDNVIPITNTKDILEVFPTWSPCGKYLYYCSARVMPETFSGENISDATSIRYDILRLTFDPQTRTFGSKADTIYHASARQLSCSLPRISPDGRKMVFAEGGYGCFHIWHHDAQIRMLDLGTGQIDSLETVNSPCNADSYPSFSSNGEWIMLASRRDDGQFSRVYISYFDGEKAHKAFLLPQQSPMQNNMRLKSYNRPEFMTEPVE